MNVLLFILYAAILSFFLARSGFLLRSGLTRTALVSLFLLYTLAGCVHLLIALHYFPRHGDIWQMFDYSVSLRQMLLHDYPAFAAEFFPSDIPFSLSKARAGWTFDEMQGLIALHLLLNFLSNDNIFINTMIFCFITIYGKVAFFRVLTARYAGRELMAFVLALVIPSVIFWTCVIHKEGVLFSAIALLLYGLQRQLAGIGRRPMVPAMLFLVAVIFLTRKAMLVPLIPALAVWIIAEAVHPAWRWRALAGFILAGILLTGLSQVFFPAFSLSHQLSEKQHEFLRLTGGSALQVSMLDDSLISFVPALPRALVNGLFMPLPGAGGKPLYYLFSLELIGIWIFVVAGMVRGRAWTSDGFIAGMMVFALATCLIIGYTVPFAGAIVRYRSVAYPFLLLPCLRLPRYGRLPAWMYRPSN